MIMRQHSIISYGGKKQRKYITSKEKLDVTEKCECNEHTADIVSATGIPRMILRTIRKQAE
jgi:hypothetical protein